MAYNSDPYDPKGLIFDSYQIEGIGAPECRSIFLDWAISVPLGEDSSKFIQVLLGKYGGDNPDHPMTRVLRDALEPAARQGRRGGARARRRSPIS